MRRFSRLGLLAPLLAALVAALPTAEAADKKDAPYVPPPLEIRWFGHAFVYITTTTGVRVAIDPWSEESSITYKFPPRLPADVVLVSAETPDHDGSARLFGSPQSFSSVTAVGVNNARGLLFRGVQTYRDKERGARQGTNAAFTFKVDGIRFCHLGAIGHTLDAEQRTAIGPVDVLFLPVGNLDLTPAEILKTARDVGAKIIVPIKFKNEWSQDLNLRTLADFLAAKPADIPVKELNSPSFTLTPEQIPATPVFYILTPDQPAASTQAPTP